MREEVAERHIAAEEYFNIASLESWRLLEGRTPASGASKGRRLTDMAQGIDHVEHHHTFVDVRH